MNLFLSILPPIVAIGLCIVTKQVITSLFFSIFVGQLILNGYNPLMAIAEVFTT